MGSHPEFEFLSFNLATFLEFLDDQRWFESCSHKLGKHLATPGMLLDGQKNEIHFFATTLNSTAIGVGNAPTSTVVLVVT